MKRRGFTLIEVLLAVALTAGPIVLVTGLVQNNINRAHKTQDLAVCRLALANLTDLLTPVALEDLRDMCSPSGKAQLEAYLAASLPGWTAERGAGSAARSTKQDSLKVTLDEVVPGHKGLVRLSLSIVTPGGSEVSLHRFLRPLPKDLIGKLFGAFNGSGSGASGSAGTTTARLAAKTAAAEADNADNEDGE